MNLFPSFVIDKRRFYAKKSTHLFVIVPNNGTQVRVNRNSVQLLLIGLCLGITLGVTVIPLFEVECFSINLSFETIEENYVNANLPNPSSGGQSGHGDISDNPKLVKSLESVNQDSRSAKIRRPRFYTTELGLRKKLVAGIILTDFMRLENLVAINKTLSPFVDQLLFFVANQRASQQLKSLGIPGVVTLSSKKNDQNDAATLQLDKPKYNRAGLRAMKYLGEKFGYSYEYFFLGLDVFYINGKILMDSVKQISISQDALWGSGDEFGTCTLETGFVLSRSVVRKLSSRLERCLLSTTLGQGNIIKKCFQYALGMSECSENIQNQFYSTAPPENSDQIISAVSIGPLSTAKEIYNIHATISEKRAGEIDQKIKNLSGIMNRMIPHVPLGYQTNSWPTGISVPHRPQSRFDVLKWKFFTQNKIYPKNEHITEMSLAGIEKLDVSSVVNISTNYLSQVLDKDVASFSFQYGYRRFDETRGMEYILDFLDTTGHTQRVECIRPLSKIEMVPMPFVTESRRVTIVVPVTLDFYDETNTFIKNYLDAAVDKRSNSVLVIAIILKKSVLTSEDATRFQSLKRLISDHNSNYSKAIGSETVDSIKVGHVVVNMEQFKTSNNALALFDMLSGRVLSPNSLVLAIDSFVALNDEFLNRVRMNTILNHQVFSPIPFQEYSPEVSGHAFDNKELEIHKDKGYFDVSSFEFISFYIGDYVTARKQVTNLGLRRTPTISLNEVSMLSQMFIQGSQVHFLRAAEPRLKVRFSENIFHNCSQNSECFKRKWGSKGELANLILKRNNQ